ncbi:hypothetical protein H2199_008376 [Coniosporium tulheliwenetii]|uniref:Uncharacterized protein n=1 Tax=Coniosporium tulheliwenetii TaxID=3383036 RepID=A0ACC2YJW0_9PEZI|nr:hypothetical protein H2199_008376 [Cladosporium sp. JES 115]
MSSSFLAKKRKIIQQLSVADEEYNDLSPKGSIDEGIRTLIDELNSIDGLILHLACASLIDAQKVLSAALTAGFRESGAVSLTSTGNGEEIPMVAVRSTGLAFDSIVGYETAEGKVVSIVDEPYLQALVAIANERFCVNTERIQRFRSAVLKQYQELPESSKHSPDRQVANSGWEDAEARQQRKREEGLQRQKMLHAEERKHTSDTDAPDSNAMLVLNDVFS